MPRVKLGTHGSIDGHCKGSGRSVSARVEKHHLTFIGSGGVKKTRERNEARCRWCKRWVGFESCE